jgi:hypothetical protein
MARFEILHKRGFSWEHFSPEINAYGDDVKEKCKRGGVFFWADRELYIGLGFNTKVVPVNDAPKTTPGSSIRSGKARSPSPEVSAIPLEATSQIRWDESLSKSSARLSGSSIRLS